MLFWHWPSLAGGWPVAGSVAGRWVGDSFPTISSSGANAAVIHYHAEHGRCKPIDIDAVYLCDTGGQYVDDTRRTQIDTDPCT